jgi:hypothetical protein
MTSPFMNSFETVQNKLVYKLQLEAVARFNLGSVAQLKSAQQNKQLIKARTWCYAKLYKQGFNYVRIADYFNREKTSVRYCLKKK